MDLFLIVILMFAGAGIGSLVGTAIPNARPEAIVMTAAVGGVLGISTAYAMLALAKPWSNRYRRSTPRSPSSTVTSHQPRSFRERLAQYAGKDEHDILNDDDSFKSSMPFWAAVNAILRFPPKSAAMIRLSLLKIRETLRG